MDCEFTNPFVYGAFPGPGLDRVVIACREKLIPMRVPLDKLNVLVVTRQDTAAGVLHHVAIFFFKDPDRFITRTCGHVLASRTPRGAFHLILLTFEGLIWLKVQLAGIAFFLKP